MHAIWKLILDEEFINVYKEGIVITCSDGIKRQVFPRVLTYSADYPEKFVPCFFFPFDCLTLILLLH